MSTDTTVREQLLSGVANVLPADGLDKKLEQNRPLRVKLGADPTAPDLHLGHAVVLCKLRQFQDAGHIVQFVIGDFTALIGDPTGKSKTRPPLSPEEVAENAKTYLEQVYKILRPDRLEIRYNSEWLSPLSFADVLKLGAKVTLARIIEREDFMKRYKEQVAIGFHELMYPLMQGYDSVALNSDIEFGGTDQTFNNLMGRFLQEQYGQEPQIVMTVPLLEGLDGVQKMSKSLNNYVGLFEPADKAFGKLMSISDQLMWRYYLLLCDKTERQIEDMKAEVVSNTLHPLAAKKAMAHYIVSRFWSSEEATAAQEQFEALFQKKDYSQGEPVSYPELYKAETWIVDVLRTLGAVKSSSEARRLIGAGAVSINGEKVTEVSSQVTVSTGDTIRVGKHRIYTLS